MGSVGKESCCNAGTPVRFLGQSRRSAGEGIGYPLQYSWASLAAQLVKNLPAMRETWVQSLGWEDPLEKGKATHQYSGLRYRHIYITHAYTCMYATITMIGMVTCNRSLGVQRKRKFMSPGMFWQTDNKNTYMNDFLV